jgi:hypothetical protein
MGLAARTENPRVGGSIPSLAIVRSSKPQPTLRRPNSLPLPGGELG